VRFLDFFFLFGSLFCVPNFQSDVMKVKISRLKATFFSVSLEPHFLLFSLPFLEPGIAISSNGMVHKRCPSLHLFWCNGIQFSGRGVIGGLAPTKLHAVTAECDRLLGPIAEEFLGSVCFVV
jgi:hypothetical protein